MASQEIPWRRLSAEVVAIVFGILLAFSIDAWWQNRGESRIEAQYLIALYEDFATSLELLDEREAIDQQQVGYLESLLLTDGSTTDFEELDLWIRDGLFTIGTYEPQLSSLRDLETSGQSRIVQDSALRRALASVSQKLERLDNVQADLVLSQQLLLDPFLVDHIDLASVLRTDKTAFEMDSAILGTKAFRSRVAFKLNLRKLNSTIQQQVRAEIVDALALTESRLEQLR